MYSKFNSKEDYNTLLEGLEHLTTELRKEMRQKRQRPRKKEEEMRFHHVPANIPLRPFPNVVTRSQRATSLILHSRLTPGPSPLDEAKPPSASNQKPNITGRLNAADQLEPAATDDENMTPSAETIPATGDMRMLARDNLKQAIERYKGSYRGKVFIVNNDERSETVLPDEIDRFFSRFLDGEWLANFNLMPLLFSFKWPSTTLVLHSSYTPLKALENGNQQPSTQVRWPIRRDHDRIILPCCFQSHWTLYDINLQRNSIQHYDSLAKDAAKPGEIVPAIKERLFHAMEGWEIPKRDFTVANGVRENPHTCVSPLCDR